MIIEIASRCTAEGIARLRAIIDLCQQLEKQREENRKRAMWAQGLPKFKRICMGMGSKIQA